MGKTYLTTSKPNPKGISYYRPQTFFQILIAPFIRNTFNDYMKKTIGNDYLTFYEGRSGVYHILMYMRKKFGSRRILLPKEISEENSYSMIAASIKADFKIIHYDGTPKNMQKNDVVLLLDSTLKLPDSVFSIQDNARNALMPSKRYDFTLYSFAIGKPLPSGRGGVVVVNRERVRSFMKMGESLVSPDIITEMQTYLRYLIYKVKNYGVLVKLMHWESLHKSIKGGTFTDEPVTHENYSMCMVSKKIASFILK